MANKNSIYVQSLVDFLLDTKPYHAKLTEIVEEYRFYDEMTVHFDERLFSNTMMKAAWMYPYFSGGISTNQVTMMHQLVSPAPIDGTFAVGSQENTDLPLVPLAFDPKSLQGVGLEKAALRRNIAGGTIDEPIMEGHDVYLSHGAYTFQIFQTISTQPIVVGHFNEVYEASDGPFPKTVTLPFTDADQLIISGPATQLTLSSISVVSPGEVHVDGLSNDLPYQPLFAEKRNENVLATATAAVQALALDTTKTNSAISQIRAILSSINSRLVTFPNATAQNELNAVRGICGVATNVPSISRTSNVVTVTWTADDTSLAAAYKPGRQVTISGLSGFNGTFTIVTAGLVSGQYQITYNHTGADASGTGNIRLTQPLLPVSYEALLNALVAAGTAVISGYAGWIGQDVTVPYTDKYVDQQLAALSTSLYFNAYTDYSQRESGRLSYYDVFRDDIEITNITADPLRPDYEEWTLEAATPTTFFVRGSISGTIGSATMPGTFSTPQIEFTLAAGSSPMTVGTIIELTPYAKITVHAQAPLEAWSLIKVNPRTYSRPVLQSTRYGYIRDLSAVRDKVTILDVAMPTTTIVLTATSATQFTFTSTAEPLYTGSATVGVTYNDGRLGFRIVQGSAYTFQPGDRFYINIVNNAPRAEDLDLFYGYDMDAFDADSMVYNSVSNAAADYLTSIDFGYDSRFTNYDLVAFNLQIAQTAVNGRSWRLRALRNTALPLPLQNSVPNNQVNQLATDDPLNPNATTQFDMPNSVTLEGIQSSTDPDLTADMQLWYASTFALEYLNGTTWTGVDIVPVGVAYNNPAHGLSFTIVQPAKPFIASRLTSSWYPATSGGYSTETVDGGDVISWTVINDDPVQTDPAGLSSPNVTHLWMHGDSFHASTAANWTLTWNGPLQYRLQGVYTAGPLTGQSVFPNPGVTIQSSDGRSYRNDQHGLHWTLYDGIVGQNTGDIIRFSTFEPKPSYLVHGSVSGWQPDAEVGKWYWNGKIGFKLNLPEVRLFENQLKIDGSPWTTSAGQVTLNSVRFDAPSMTYTLRSHVNGHWTLYRDGRVVADGSSTVADQYINLTVPTGVAGTLLVIDVIGESHALAMGNDLAIIRTDAGRTPVAGESVLIRRTESDDISVSIKPVNPGHQITLARLAPVTIDLRYVDHNALSGVPLSATSPETAILPGWIPALQTRYDTASSIAEFSDPQTKVVLRAAATGETIGTITSLSANPMEPVVMQWDPAFHAAYMPLNTEANIVTLGSGLDEHVDVNITEGIMFLLSGGGLQDNAMFTDVMSVAFGEQTQWNILSQYNSNVGVAIADGPFAGFLPGYDNLPFDFEQGGDVNLENGNTGYYDVGIPLSDHFLRAQYLSNLIAGTPNPTLDYPTETEELDALLALIDPFLDGNSLVGTTLDEFIANVNSAVALNSTLTPSFGVPALGMGMDINQSSTSVAGAAVVEATTIVATDFGTPYDLREYDVDEYDEAPDSVAYVLIQQLPNSVKCASTVNRALSGLASVDGVTLVAGDRVLLKNQTSTSANGVYIAAAGAWVRATDWNSVSEFELGREVQVLEGTAHHGTVWQVSTAPTSIGASPIAFTQVLTYAAFDGPLFTAEPGGRIIELSLTFDYLGTPKVHVWLPTWSAPASAIVDKISNRVFRLSLPTRSEFKLIAG